jgi:transposase-like protein
MVKTDNEKVLIGRYSTTGRYDQRFIKQVVQEIEEGLPRKAACIEYGLKFKTLNGWMVTFASAAYKDTHKREFCTAIKRSVVRAVTAGTMSIKEALTAYDIKDGATIKRWIAQEKRENAELVAINTPVLNTKKQTDSSSNDLQAAHEALKKQLEEAQLKIFALNTLIDVAEEQLKINIRKKPGAKQP